MKSIPNLAAALILWVSTCHQSDAASFTAAPRLKVGDLTPYPWSETDEHVRIPKALLPQLDIMAVELMALNGPDVPWRVTDQFSQIYRLSPAEEASLESHLTKAKYEIRRAEGRHLIPVEGPVPIGGYKAPQGLVVLEQFKFKLTSYQDELREIERNLRLAIRDTLGKDRSEEFWKLSHALLWILQKFDRDAGFQGHFFQSHTFRLIEFRSALSVDLVTASSGGSSGGPHLEWEDQFVPDVLKPVLKRWRAAIMEYTVTNKPPEAGKVVASDQARKTGATTSHLKEASKSAKSPGSWDESAAYVDLPKNSIPALGVPGFSDDDTVSPEAVVVFGLSPEETKAVENLFVELQDRFERIEKDHLTRPNGAENHFVLRPFPDAAKELQGEWRKRLGKAIGTGRAEFLDQAVRARGDANFTVRRMLAGKPFDRLRQDWPVWLNRGTKELQFDMVSQGGPKGITSIRYRVIDNNPHGGGGWDMGGPGMAVPSIWKHLFTVEMLSPDIRRGPKEL